MATFEVKPCTLCGRPVKKCDDQHYLRGSPDAWVCNDHPTNAVYQRVVLESDDTMAAVKLPAAP